WRSRAVARSTSWVGVPLAGGGGAAGGGGGVGLVAVTVFRKVVVWSACVFRSRPPEVRANATIDPAIAAPKRSAMSKGQRALERRDGRGGARGGGIGARVCVFPAASSKALRSDSTRSVQVVYRAVGSFARACSKTASSSHGSRSERSHAEGTGSFTCAAASAVGDSRSNGRWPVRSSKATTPRE